MKPIRCFPAVLVVALALTASSCSKRPVTAPVESAAALSPTTRSGLAALQSALESPAWKSLDALNLAGGPARAAAGVRPVLRDAVTETPALAATVTTSSLVGDVASEMSRRVSGPLAAVIPPEVRGTTYVFDPDRRRYVPDAAREGAPENGVRYVLYAVNPLTGEPVVSEEIGYADLTDEGDEAPNTASLRLRAVSGGITFVDYGVTLAAAAGAGGLAVHGTFFDGHKHLAFGIQAHGEGDEDSQSLALEFQLVVPEDGFTLADQAHAVATPTDSTLRARQTVHVGGNTFSIVSVQKPDLLDATVAVNGAPFAHIHGEAGVLVVLRPDGRPLPAEERAALAQLLGLFDGVSRLLVRLLEPVGVLFSLVPRA